MSVRNLGYLYDPSSLVLVGATDNTASIAGAVTRHLIEGFKGDVHLVNPARENVLGRKCYRSIETVPATPDLAIIATPADEIIGIVEALGRAGVKAATIITDPKRGSLPAVEVRRRLFELAQKYDLRINGPNCLGVSVPGIGLYASMSRIRPEPGSIAFVGQSATAAGPLIDWATERELGFSYVISLGDMIDVDYADVLYFLAECRKTRCIVLYAERLPNARKFMSAARVAARIKPVIIMKAGAVLEVTPLREDMPTRDTVYSAAFRRAGLLRVRTLEGLFDAVEALSARRPADTLPARGERLAILSNGESIGTMAQDSLIERGGTLATLSPETVDRLQAILPPGRPRINPIDILPDADGTRYAQSLSALMGDKNIDTILVLAGPTGMAPATETAQAVIDAVQTARQSPGRRRPWVITSWPGGIEAATARKLFAEAHVPTFQTPSTAIAVFCFLTNHRAAVQALMETPASIPAAFDVDPVKAKAVIDKALERGPGPLPPESVADLLGCYGLTYGRPEAADADLLYWRIVCTIDPEFGPVLTFGVGGQYGRLFDRGVVSLPPLNQTLARNVILSDSGGQALFGLEGMRTQDQERALADAALALVQVSQIVVDLDRVCYVRLEPLHIGPKGVFWEDAAIEVEARTSDTAHHAQSRLAIRPYPKELESPMEGSDGSTYLLRPIRPEDEPRLRELFTLLSPEDIRMRFFRPMKVMNHDMAASLTQIDYDRQMAFVLTDSGLPGETPIYGVARLVRHPNEDSAEYAVIVRTDMHGRGLGKLLMERIIEYGRSIGLASIFGLVLTENAPMLGLNRQLGFEIERDETDPGILKVVFTY